MSEDVHQKLKELAEKDNRTLSSFIEINLLRLIEK
jgi:predicted transcriptional regulator